MQNEYRRYLRRLLVDRMGLTKLPVDWAPPSTHKAHVQRLYKLILKTTLDWAAYRDDWYPIVGKVREVFESRRGESNTAIIQKYIEEGEQWVHNHFHPEPVIVPEEYGGTKFQRNTPFDPVVRAYAETPVLPSCIDLMYLGIGSFIAN